MQEQEKVLKVSDWSQKYKLAIYAVSGIGICVIGIKVLNVLNTIVKLLEIIANK